MYKRIKHLLEIHLLGAKKAKETLKHPGRVLMPRKRKNTRRPIITGK